LRELAETSALLFEALISRQAKTIDMILQIYKGMATTPYIDTHASPYHKPLFMEMFRHFDLKGKVVVEIGPDAHFITARLCLANGAQKVLACTPAKNWVHWQDLPEGIEPVFKNFLDTDVPIPPQSVDIVFGVALLEHLEDLETVFQKIYSILAPGGKIFMQGGPCWTSMHGHHLWATKDVSVPYRFTGRNPVPHWSHLVFTPEEMQNFLIRSGELAAPEDAQAIVREICYTSPPIGSNKQTPTAMADAFRKYFYCLEKRELTAEANAYYHKASAFWSEKDLQTHSISLTGRKKKLSQDDTPVSGMVSVVIPCYNVAEYVEECVESVLAQDYENIEVILVDDASTDGTRDILARYAIQNTQVHLVEHAYNLVQGPARNSGVKAMRGEYLLFLDSDDYLVSPDTISKLVTTLQKQKVHVVIGSSYKLLPSGERQDSNYPISAGRLLTSHEAFCSTLALEGHKYIPITAWGVLFNAAFYKAQQLPFPAIVHEDMSIMPFLFYRALGVYYTDQKVVVYRIRKTSLSNAPWSIPMCVNNSMLWKSIRQMAHAQGLEKHLHEMAISLMCHNIYRISNNGIYNNAINDFITTMQYLMRDIDTQRDLLPLLLEFAKFFNTDPEHYLFRELITMLPEQTILEAGRKKALAAPIHNYNAIVFANQAADTSLHDAIFVDYHANCPDTVKKIPAMLTEADRAAYFYFAKHASMCGAIIDAGCFVGGTTTALIEGLKQNPLFDPWRHSVYVYDLFKIDAPYIMRWLRNIYGEALVPDTMTDFRCFFEKNMKSYSNNIRLHPGDIIEIGYPHKQPIEVLGLDCCKALEVTDSVIRDFFPYLVPHESVVIHQDYIHEWHPYIHVSMELLQEYFEPLVEFNGGGSYVWRCIKRITPACIERIFGLRPTSGLDDYAWWHQEWARNDILLQKKQLRLQYPVNQACLGMVRSMYAQRMGLADLATLDAQEILTIYADLPCYPEEACVKQLLIEKIPPLEARNKFAPLVEYIMLQSSDLEATGAEIHAARQQNEATAAELHAARQQNEATAAELHAARQQNKVKATKLKKITSTICWKSLLSG
jgi:glycosyltransferase involved in cell wall biosynthesis/SAM-dependent methyltransferase